PPQIFAWFPNLLKGNTIVGFAKIGAAVVVKVGNSGLRIARVRSPVVNSIQSARGISLEYGASCCATIVKGNWNSPASDHWPISQNIGCAADLVDPVDAAIPTIYSSLNVILNCCPSAAPPACTERSPGIGML